MYQKCIIISIENITNNTLSDNIIYLYKKLQYQKYIYNNQYYRNFLSNFLNALFPTNINL